MANRSKNIGTKAETITVAVAKRNGFPYAKRTQLSGALDKGDIHLGDGTDSIIEVKGGKQCLSLTPAKMSKWIAETRAEAKNSDSRMAFLVTQVAGYGLGNGEKWYAHFPTEFWHEVNSKGGHTYMDAAAMCLDYVTTDLGTALRLVKVYLDGTV